MEWVETTGRTLEEAKEAALDELGVDAEDAEFEVLEEPKQGLFGRLRSEGRVRARVRPVAPPSKDDRRRRGRSGRSGGRSGPKGSAEAAEATTDDTPPNAVAETTEPETPDAGATLTPVDTASDDGGEPGDGGDGTGPGAAGRRRRNRSRRRPDAATSSADETGEPDDAAVGEPPARATGDPDTDGGAPASGGRRRSGRQPARRGTGSRQPQDRDEEGSDVEVALDEQAAVATEFLRGLVDEFGLSAEIASAQPDDDTVELTLNGPDLGLLIGPKGSTLLAIQDLTRTVVQRKTGAGNGRIHVDVGGYRQKRAEALSRFAHQIADEVKRTGVRKALEPMSAPDRKVVHDALTDVEGVSTMSEGEDSRRRVVISPNE